jgi:predicted metal-dependent RNase
MSGQSPFTQAQLDALTNAIAQGVTSVEYNGRKVTYTSIPQMIALRDRMMRELAKQSDGVPRPLANRAVFVRQ